MLTQKQIRSLGWAIEEAACWRGVLTGNPDSGILAAFDQRVKEAKEAHFQLKVEFKEGATQGMARAMKAKIDASPTMVMPVRHG